MSTYFMLECYGPDDADRASIETVHMEDRTRWYSGKRIRSTVPKPVKVTMSADGGLMVPMFQRGILLFSDELIAALRGAGVDNLDCYDAELLCPWDQSTRTDYKAVNIIGLVAAADLARSDCATHGSPVVDVDFESLVIDETKARGLLLYRLAECVTGIAAHVHLKANVEAAGIQHLDWVDPADWIG